MRVVKRPKDFKKKICNIFSTHTNQIEISQKILGKISDQATFKETTQRMEYIVYFIYTQAHMCIYSPYDILAC